LTRGLYVRLRPVGGYITGVLQLRWAARSPVAQVIAKKFLEQGSLHWRGGPSERREFITRLGDCVVACCARSRRGSCRPWFWARARIQPLVVWRSDCATSRLARNVRLRAAQA